MPRRTCRLSGEPLEAVLDLGEPFVSDFLSAVDPAAPRGRLRLGLAPTSGFLQMYETVDPDLLYRRYWYRSGTNATMRGQLADVVRTAEQWVRFDVGDVVLDIGCNDGTLLASYPRDVGLVTVGVDPAANLAPEARAAVDLHATAYFDGETVLELTDGRQAKVITTIAMFYDLDDPCGFTRDLLRCLRPDGVWILQLSYTPLMLQQNAFDNICHEHVGYHSLRSLLYLFDRHDLEVLDAELNEVNGGSVRLVVTRRSNERPEAAGYRLELGRVRREALRTYEDNQGFHTSEVHHQFAARVDRLRCQTLELLDELTRQGKQVWGYGASTKGNTLLQYYGITTEQVTAIADRQPQKVGRVTTGSWIPIVSEQEMRAARPDYLLVLPWHFTDEFLSREADLRRDGTRFIIPLPELRVV